MKMFLPILTHGDSTATDHSTATELLRPDFRLSVLR